MHFDECRGLKREAQINLFSEMENEQDFRAKNKAFLGDEFRSCVYLLSFASEL